MLGVVFLSHLVQDLCDLCQDAKAMGETRGNVQAASVLGGQVDSNPSPVGGGGAPDVDGDVEDLPLHNPDELPLSLGLLLVVETPEDSLPRPGKSVLSENHGDAKRSEVRVLIGLRKGAPLVLKHGCLNENKIGYVQPLEPERH